MMRSLPRLCTFMLLLVMAICVQSPAMPPARVRLFTADVRSPVVLTSAPGDAQHVYVAQRLGLVRVFDKETGVAMTEPLLDLTDQLSIVQDNGLLGLAFDPAYATNGFVYVCYNTLDQHSLVERYHVPPGTFQADPESAHTILKLARPLGHNGGWIGFSPINGYLYITSGDGDLGGTLDFAQRAQNITDQLLGKILRIIPHGDAYPDDPLRNYTIPASNPFVGVTGDDEIWGYGVRNPWRGSFDRITGDFYFGDVGMETKEELNFEPGTSTGGRNYGWPCMEGITCTTSLQCACDGAELTDPMYDYGRLVGICIIGGHVYRGSAIPELDGLYFFADYLGAKIWSLRAQPDGTYTEFVNRSAEFIPLGSTQPIRFISAFGEDADGELYICVLADRIYKVVPRLCLPEIDESPASVSLAVGRTITLRALVGGAEPMTFSWRKQNQPVSDDERVTGSQTSTLTITSAEVADSGSYHLVVTGSCGTVSTAPATVEIFTCPSADMNQNGVLTVQDLFDYLTAYFTNDPRADINQSGELTVQDLFDYLFSYFAYCL